MRNLQLRIWFVIYNMRLFQCFVILQVIHVFRRQSHGLFNRIEYSVQLIDIICFIYLWPFLLIISSFMGASQIQPLPCDCPPQPRLQVISSFSDISRVFSAQSMQIQALLQQAHLLRLPLHSCKLPVYFLILFMYYFQ